MRHWKGCPTSKAFRSEPILAVERCAQRLLQEIDAAGTDVLSLPIDGLLQGRVNAFELSSKTLPDAAAAAADMRHIKVNLQGPVAYPELDHIEAILQLVGECDLTRRLRQTRHWGLVGIERVVGDEGLTNLGLTQPRSDAFVGDHDLPARFHNPIHFQDS